MKELAEVIEAKPAFPVSAREWESGPRQETATRGSPSSGRTELRNAWLEGIQKMGKGEG